MGVGKIKLILENITLAVQSLFWRRNRDTILFGGWFGERFADTSRFLFQFLSDNKKLYKLSHVVWVTRSHQVCEEIRSLGYEAYIIGTSESDYFHKRASIHFICNMSNVTSGYETDIDTKFSFGAKRVNLWHGVMPMKGVSYASNDYKNKKAAHPFICRMQELLIKKV